MWYTIKQKYVIIFKYGDIIGKIYKWGILRYEMGRKCA